jgi:hypothetical protein
MIVFESEDAAQRFVVSVRSGPPSYSMNLGSVEVGEVWAHAQARTDPPSACRHASRGNPIMGGNGYLPITGSSAC